MNLRSRVRVRVRARSSTSVEGNNYKFVLQEKGSHGSLFH